MKKLPLLTIIMTIFAYFAVTSIVKPTYAAASLYLSGPSTGLNPTISVNIDTNGTYENTYDIVVTYSGSVNSVTATTTGGICTQTVSAGSTSSTTVGIQCGTSRPGFAGTGTIGFITASLSGNATFTISSATIYNGPETTDTVSSTGGPLVILNSTNPTPTAVTTTVQATATPIPTYVKRTLATPVNAGNPASFAVKITPKPSVTTANQPSVVVVTQPKITFTPAPSTIPEKIIITPSTENIQTLVAGYFNNAAAAILFILPILALLIMVGFMSFRMFEMNRRRQREIELLFEHEMGELAALESKMDLINEKGDKGKKEFKEEFERTKDQILKEIRPEYIGNDVDTTPKE